MRWQASDLEKYIEAKAYIDTALIPLQSFQLEDDAKMVEQSFQRELLTLFSYEIEKELSGRILLIPEFNYVTTDMERETERLNRWTKLLLNQPFKTIILMTFDSGWNRYNKQLEGDLLWLPSIEKGDLSSPEMKQQITNQIRQISEHIRSFW